MLEILQEAPMKERFFVCLLVLPLFCPVGQIKSHSQTQNHCGGDHRGLTRSKYRKVHWVVITLTHFNLLIGMLCNAKTMS